MGKRIYRFQPREGVLLEKADFTGLDRRTVVVVPPGVLAFFIRRCPASMKPFCGQLAGKLLHLFFIDVGHDTEGHPLRSEFPGREFQQFGPVYLLYG